MKKNILTVLLTAFCAFGILAGSVGATSSEVAHASAEDTTTTTEFIDYAGQAVLDLNAETETVEVTLHSCIDGDTTHFNAKGFPNGILKARYAAVNTPESTGKIEEWGKKASRYTKECLTNATSIIIESDADHWETDSTGDRYLSWVWYKSSDDDVYHNLNLELLQQGLGRGTSAITSRYGTLAIQAITQADAFDLHVYSKELDPDFFYGTSLEIDLKELRLNMEYYKDKRVAFEGVVAYYNNQGVYVEDYDEETEMYYGVYVYYGFFLDTYAATTVLANGNKVRISGVVGEFQGSYQVTDLTYNDFLPGADDIQMLEKGHSAANVETSGETFTSTVSVTADFTTEDEDGNVTTTTETKNIKYAELALNSSISMNGLKVVDAYTTDNGGNNDGAMTLTCKTTDNRTVTVRTIVLKNHATGEIATEDMLIGKTIDVVGVIDHFNGSYQIKILSIGAIKVDGGPLFPPVEPQPPLTSTPSETTEEKGGCGSVIAVSAVLPLVAAAFVLLKKREN